MKKIVIDTNILISSLINRNGLEYSIITDPYLDFKFFAPYFLFIEVIKHKNKILKCSKLSESEFLSVVYKCIKRISFVNEILIDNSNLIKAKNFINNVDRNDIIFVALSLELDATLWTGDKLLISTLKKSSDFRIATTKDIILNMFD